MKLTIFTMNYRDCVKKIDNWKKEKKIKKSRREYKTYSKLLSMKKIVQKIVKS